jgi:hypothetical protein
MKGGFLLNDTHESKTIKDAIEFFKKNSTFSILTNSSRACITFKAVLKASIDSPFIQIRSGIIEQPVTTLLFKYFPINTLDPNTEILFVTHAHRGGFLFIPLAHISDIQKEYDIQLQVYQTTYNTISSAYEPVCPYPIHCFTDLDKNTTIQEIIDRLDKTNKEETENKLIITEITDTLGGAIDSLITDIDKAHIQITRINATEIFITYPNARTKIKTLGCIVMEFMDGYTTLSDYLNRCHDIRLIKDPILKKEKFIEAFGQSEYDKYEQNFVPLKPGEIGIDKAFYEIYDKVSKKANSLAAYELVRLKQIGFIHDDLHDGNIMYNPNYKYITNDDKDVEHKGRALIIDFGESLINKEILEDEEKHFYSYYKEVEKVENVYERRVLNRKFHPSYTFEEIYSRRLDVTLAFREKMIQGLETMLDEFKKLTTKEEKTKFVQDKKIQLKLDLITNLKWPTNFVNPNVGDFEKEEFDTPFKGVQIPIFETSNEKIQTLTQKRDEIIPKVQALIEFKEPESESTKILETEATKAFNRLEYLTNKFTNLFSPSQSVHVGGRYITSHKTHNDFANRLDGRIRTTLRIKRRQTKRRKRGKRSKKGKRKKQTKRKKINN